LRNPRSSDEEQTSKWKTVYEENLGNSVIAKLTNKGNFI
jgi:hypothetical protein